MRLCHDHEVAIIADEVFYDYDLEPFDGNARLAGETGTLTFALDGFSKTLAAPHAKWVGSKCPARRLKWMRPSADSTWSPTTICQ